MTTKELETLMQLHTSSINGNILDLKEIVNIQLKVLSEKHEETESRVDKLEVKVDGQANKIYSINKTIAPIRWIGKNTTKAVLIAALFIMIVMAISNYFTLEKLILKIFS